MHDFRTKTHLIIFYKIIHSYVHFNKHEYNCLTYLIFLFVYYDTLMLCINIIKSLKMKSDNNIILLMII